MNRKSVERPTIAASQPHAGTVRAAATLQSPTSLHRASGSSARDASLIVTSGRQAYARRRSLTSPRAAEPEDREQEGREEHLDADNQERRGQQGEPRLRERARAARNPAADDPAADGEAREDQGGAGEQPVLELHARPNALEPGVALAEHVDAVGARAEAEREDLRADDRQQRAADHRVDIPAAAEDADVRQHADHDEDPEAGEDG